MLPTPVIPNQARGVLLKHKKCAESEIIVSCLTEGTDGTMTTSSVFEAFGDEERDAISVLEERKRWVLVSGWPFVFVFFFGKSAAGFH